MAEWLMELFVAQFIGPSCTNRSEDCPKLGEPYETRSDGVAVKRLAAARPSGNEV